MGLCSVYWPFFLLIRVEAVPPEACFANFRWDDCGRSPVPVMYYWKPGSRCEVGLWRGCLPNLNMFQDEYECVTTCIFTARALPEDYHSMKENEIEGNTEFTTELVTVSGDNTEVTTANVITVVDDGVSSASVATTVVSGGDTGGKDSNSTVAGDNATTAAGAGEAATTAAPAV